MCEGVKKVSGVLSKWEVISQLAPHIERLAPSSAIKKETRNNCLILKFKRGVLEVFNYSHFAYEAHKFF
jgi:hypothetical protein